MKKITSVALVALIGALAFASCKKTNKNGQYTCTCTYRETGATADSTTKIVFPTGYTQASASSACSSESSSLASLWPGAHCSL